MKNKKWIIIISVIIVAIIILIAILFFGKGFFNKNEEIEDIESYSIEDIESYSIEDTIKVKGKEELEIVGLEIIDVDGEKYIEGTLKNTSNKNIEDVNINIRVFDQNGNEVLPFVIYMDNIKPNDTMTFQMASPEDLSEINEYSASI